MLFKCKDQDYPQYCIPNHYTVMWKLDNEKSWQGGNWFIQNVVLEESFIDIMNHQKDKYSKCVLDQIYPELSLEWKTSKMKVFRFWHIMNKWNALVMLGKVEDSEKTED